MVVNIVLATPSSVVGVDMYCVVLGFHDTELLKLLSGTEVDGPERRQHNYIIQMILIIFKYSSYW